MKLILAAFGSRLLASDFSTVKPHRNAPLTQEEEDVVIACRTAGWEPLGAGDPWEEPQ